MSFNVAMLEAMQAEGLDLDACIRVLKAGEKRADPTAAERKRRQRAKAVSRVTSRRDPPNDNISNPPEISEPEGSSSPTFRLPDDIPSEPWADFEEMRKRIKKPMTDKARQLAVNELRRLRDDAGWPPGDVLNHCTMNSYQGIYPPKDRRNDRQSPKSDSHTADAYRLLNGDAA